MKYTYEQVLKFAQELSKHTGSNKYNDKKYKKWAEIQIELEETNSRSSTSEKDFSNLIMVIAQAKKYLNEKDKASLLPTTLDSSDRNSKLDANLDRAVNQLYIFQTNNKWFASIVPSELLSQPALVAPKPVSVPVKEKPKPAEEASSTKPTHEQLLKLAKDLSAAAKVAGPSKYNEVQYYNEKEKKYKDWDKITWDEIESLLKDNSDFQREALMKKGGLADYVMVIAQAKKFLIEHPPSSVKIISDVILKSRNHFLDDKVERTNMYLKSLQTEGNPYYQPDWYPVVPVSNAKGKSELSGTHYAYEAKSNEDGRWYHAFKVNAETLKEEPYKGLIGDRLKTKILEHFKRQIEDISTPELLNNFKNTVKETAEYKVLATSQGITTRVINSVGLFGQKNTSSIDALNQMLDERTEQINKGNKGPQT